MKKQDVKWDCYAWLSDPALSRCSPSARGIWMDLLCAMYLESSPSISGSSAALCRLSRCTLEEMEGALNELDSTGTAEVSRHDNGEVTLTSRRLEKGLEARKKGAKRQRDYRERHSGNASITQSVTATSQQKNNNVTKKGGYRGDQEELKEKGDARGKNQLREMKNASVTPLSQTAPLAGDEEPFGKHPAVSVFVRQTERFPGAFFEHKIAATVGDDEQSLLLFEAILTAWKDRGWNFMQVTNVLDDFLKQKAKLQALNMFELQAKPGLRILPDLPDEDPLEQDPDEARRIREGIRQGKMNFIKVQIETDYNNREETELPENEE